MRQSAEKEEKFHTVYALYKARMAKIAHKYCTVREDAEDALQNALLAILRNLDKLEDPASPATAVYVCKATKSACIDLLRRRHGSEPPLDCEALVDSTDIPGDAARQDLYARALHFLGTLPQIYVDTLTLYLVNGLGVREIARITGEPVGTVKTRIRRGQAMLREKFKGEL